jgi:cell division protein FtsW
MTERKPIDYTLLVVVLLLMGTGVLMVYSSSAIFAQERFHDSLYFLKRNVIFTLISLVLLILTTRINYHFYYKFTYPLLLITLALLFLTFVPGIGHRAGGAQRWIGVAGLTLQPSEIAKWAVLVFMAYSLAKKKEKMKSFTVGFLPAVSIVGLILACILLQKDLGTAFVIAVVVLLLFFIGGTRLSYLAGGLLASIPILYLLIFSVDYRRRRILAFLDPWAHQLEEGFQVIQSYVAFNSGGLTGVGLGQGKQKLFYLPAAYTDFIFANLGEELGLIGVFAVMALFLTLMIRGIRIALKAPDLFGTYLAIGITSLITTQALINFGVVMGLLPTKGLPLPFISHGGTALMVMAILVGILLNISSQSAPLPGVSPSPHEKRF